MYELIVLVLGVAVFFLMLFAPQKMLETKHLPALFGDEPERVVELRPDLARSRQADTCYRICLLRSYITYSVQETNGDVCELIEVTYRGRPGPVLEMENDRPFRFGSAKSKEPKLDFSPREQRDIAVFVRTVRTLVSHARAFP